MENGGRAEIRVWQQTAIPKIALQQPRMPTASSARPGQDSPAFRVSAGTPADAEPLTRSRFVSFLPSLSSGTTMLAFSLGEKSILNIFLNLFQNVRLYSFVYYNTENSLCDCVGKRIQGQVGSKYTQVMGEGRRKDVLLRYYFRSSRVKQLLFIFLFCVSFKHFQI